MKKKLYILLIAIGCSTVVDTSAQNPPVDDGGPDDFPSENPPVDDGGADDFPAAPIDDYIIPMALLGIAVSGYWLIRKRKIETE